MFSGTFADTNSTDRARSNVLSRGQMQMRTVLTLEAVAYDFHHFLESTILASSKGSGRRESIRQPARRHACSVLTALGLSSGSAHLVSSAFLAFAEFVHPSRAAVRDLVVTAMADPQLRLPASSSRRHILISLYRAPGQMVVKNRHATQDFTCTARPGRADPAFWSLQLSPCSSPSSSSFSAMARIHSILASAVALLATAVLSSSGVQAADTQPLPWDGTFQDLTVATLTDKYLTHILTNRQNGTVDPDQWTTVTPKGRSPAFNGDTGVATLAVDAEAIFGGQTNFRRSELVQNVAGNTAGTTFFRVSLMKEEAYLNLYSWQVVFPESHLFEIRIDASVDPVQLVWYTGGGTETRWSTEFKTKTWYNFGIAVSSGELALYFSEGDDALALTKTETNSGAVPTDYEFHFGQLTLSNDGSAVKMAAGKQDVLSFNGVTVESSIPSDLGSAASSTASSSTGSASTSTSTSTTTTAPTATTATPTATTASPSTETTTSAASEAASAAADETTDAPAAPTATEAPSTSTTGESADTDSSASLTDAPTTSTSGCKVRRRN
ncbi:hypothetical protein PHYPSEUDO_015443 [Phytophthora pseudosyringae]|uniref:Glycoside hydrolase 131 catalytic N-terminal domain-containing protein n=1 Tax=Phytophthora pseudosyringae TaxID=221518 RepID=A0A8T1W3S4_9STRA|nr:hypothetical protein PHYPSEUDO_015443 [Phytophthora pseudosyringae]